jgi:hypothetical protein
LIYHDIFNNKNITTREIVKKYFKTTEAINRCEYNVALTNAKCSAVAAAVRKSQNKKKEYYAGEFLICRDYIKKGDITCKKNFEYEILNVWVKSETLTLRETHSNITITLPIDTVRKSFIFRYYCTAYSLQGSSIDEEINIFEWNHWYATKEWLWVAITRARKLDNVYFYDGLESPEFNQELVYNYFNKKIQNYKKQDKAAGRDINSGEYVSADWFMDKFHNKCHHCKNNFNFDFNRGMVSTDITADRINNELAHYKSNCVISCNVCNCSKK